MRGTRGPLGFLELPGPGIAKSSQTVRSLTGAVCAKLLTACDGTHGFGPFSRSGGMISDFPAVFTSASRVCPARDEAVSALPETMSL